MDSNTLFCLYETTYNGLVKTWRLDIDTMNFIEADHTTDVKSTIIVQNNAYYKYQNYYYRFTSGEWERTETPPALYTDILPSDVKITIAKKYQKNEYYYYGSFKYLTKGSIVSTVNQPLSGLEMDLQSRTIRIDTDIDIREQDVVVIEGLSQYRCYIVENAEVTQKRMPKAFNILKVTLNALK